jgi:hypothetical protein
MEVIRVKKKKIIFLSVWYLKIALYFKKELHLYVYRQFNVIRHLRLSRFNIS